MLDEAVNRSFSERLRNDRDIFGKITKPSGALGNVVPKIDMLYLLYSFEKPVRNAMYGITDIRNSFAHNITASFNSTRPKFIEAIENLKLHQGMTHFPHHIDAGRRTRERIEQIKTPRDRFLVNLRLCLLALMQDRCSHKTWSNFPLSKKDIRKIVKDVGK